MPKVIFYGDLIRYTNGEKEVYISAKSIKQLLKALAERYGNGLASRIMNEGFEPKEFVRIFINDKDARLIDKDKELSDDDSLIILPALSGG